MNKIAHEQGLEEIHDKASRKNNRRLNIQNFNSPISCTALHSNSLTRAARFGALRSLHLATIHDPASVDSFDGPRLHQSNLKCNAQFRLQTDAHVFEDAL